MTSTEMSVDALHHKFRAGLEASKVCSKVAMFMSISAAVFASLGSFMPTANQIRQYVPLAVVAATAVAFVARAFRNTQRSFAERCRRLVIRSYGWGEVLELQTISDVIEDCPAVVEHFAKRLSRVSISTYYTTTKDPGRERILEIYAESAFFTRRLLHWYMWLLSSALAALLALAISLMYWSAVELGSAPSSIDRVYDIVFCCAVAGIAVHLAETAVDAKSACHQIRAIEDRLLSLARPRRQVAEVRALTRDYDVEHFCAPLIPTLLYRLRSEALSRAWATRKSVIDAASHKE